ncbi:hypothetical protein Fmac_013211 [Flemingia macrophylla]|uniref:Protein BIG GRAIN 1-like B n=1 Tax=Flemingia macrophylla TaxID=520843 RepID=A0ABD1MUR8_9FABA
MHSSPQRRRTPSFSSSLLDAIYHSIDDQKPNLHHHPPKERMNLRRAVMLQDWMDNNNNHTNSHSHSHSLGSYFVKYSTSSSSECSSAGIFSSSETDTTTTLKKQKPRPTSEKQKKKKKKNKEGGGFARALKIYGEFNQRVKQPISPGSRIATFLASIFNSHNVKKAKMCYVGAVEDVTFDHKTKSPCFSSTPSASSTRSCMTKTPSSAKKSNDGVKRFVRFYPVSFILGEDSQPQPPPQPSYSKCNSVSESDLNLSVRKITRNSSIKELKNNTKENGIEEAAARGFNIKGYRKSGKSEFDFRGFYDNVENENEDDVDDDNDDDASCSSSDLFELDHLIGAARYQEELPVYETTNLETNKAIASGLCL